MLVGLRRRRRGGYISVHVSPLGLRLAAHTAVAETGRARLVAQDPARLRGTYLAFLGAAAAKEAAAKGRGGGEALALAEAVVAELEGRDFVGPAPGKCYVVGVAHGCG